MAKIHPPFTENDKERIEAALLNTKVARDVLNRAERAGDDVTEQRSRLVDSEKRLKGYKTQFFAG